MDARTPVPLAALSDPKDRTIGAYVISNSVNGRLYVGSSIRVGRRIWTHLNHLRRQMHHAPELQADFNTFGQDVFVCWIHEECATKGDALAAEQALLDSALAGGLCYNVSTNAAYSMACSRTQERARQGRINSEAFRAHALRQIAKLQTPEIIAMRTKVCLESARFHENSKKQGENLKRLLSKPVISRSLVTGEEVTYPSAKAAMDAIGAKTSALICKKSRSNGNAYGFAWRYPDVV